MGPCPWASVYGHVRRPDASVSQALFFFFLQFSYPETWRANLAPVFSGSVFPGDRWLFRLDGI